jgi:hypothetical protein
VIDLKTIKEIFDDKITKAAGIVFLLIVALVLFNTFSNLTLTHPLFGVLLYTLVPILFVAGGIIFVLAILKS